MSGEQEAMQQEIMDLIDLYTVGGKVSEMALSKAISERYAGAASAEDQLPNERGANRYGLDMAYFRKTINRELNRPLDNFTPAELARVFARLSVAADESVVLEPEFQNRGAASAGEGVPVEYEPLTDEECDKFRRSPKSFNGMLRAVHMDGWVRYVAAAQKAKVLDREKLVKDLEEGASSNLMSRDAKKAFLAILKQVSTGAYDADQGGDA